jgi:hypothetical protein
MIPSISPVPEVALLSFRGSLSSCQYRLNYGYWTDDARNWTKTMGGSIESIPATGPEEF